MPQIQKYDYPQTVHCWDCFEITCIGPENGNPFVDLALHAVFTHKDSHIEVEGFYDGSGIYRVRFMPDHVGEYNFQLTGTFLDIEHNGSFTVLPAQDKNHGMVHVHDTYHFKYDDGEPYYSIGTTCYVWNLQTDELVAQTLETLKNSAFNKIRFCIFPKHYVYNLHEPWSYPFVGTPMDSSVLTKKNYAQYDEHSEGNQWDFSRFQPEHFKRIEYCILQLQKLGIEADIILFHPYDRWGFSCMTAEDDARYIRYVVARLSAYRNVWWSLANEYDLMHHKTEEDWENIAQTICRYDPYEHLRSIHHCLRFYDYNQPWVTHCSIQRTDLYKGAELVNEWRDSYHKPIVLDEIAYEGNIPFGWGNITGEEMLRRFWEGAMRGGYPGHGETYIGHKDILWWSHGGKLHGESHKRFAFLLEILKQTPGIGLCPNPECAWDEVSAIPQDKRYQKQYYLYYYSFMRPSSREFFFDADTDFEVTVLDTWNGTAEKRGVFKGHFQVELPSRQYMAIQIKQIKL